MKKAFALATAIALGSVSFAQAQTPITGTVIGDTGDLDFPIKIRGTDGVIYKCSHRIYNVNGQQSRRCVSDDDDAFASQGLGGGAAAGIVVLVAAALAGAGGGSSTTTTN